MEWVPIVNDKENSMTIVTNAVDGVSPYAQAIPDAPIADKSKNEMNSEQFMKLLVAQLKYQDPSSPQDPAAFMAQTAQFTELETMQKIEKALKEEIVATRSAGAASMIGSRITGKPSNATDGTEITGVVTKVVMGVDGPILKVGESEIPYANIKEVSG